MLKILRISSGDLPWDYGSVLCWFQAIIMNAKKIQQIETNLDEETDSQTSQIQ